MSDAKTVKKVMSSWSNGRRKEDEGHGMWCHSH